MVAKFLQKTGQFWY